MGDIHIREMGDEDIPEVLEVLRASLGETPLLERTPDLWRWKHIDNPFGRSLALVAVEGSRIAGVRALMRWDLITPAGDTIRCLRPVDTATHPDFERRGIFRNLTETAIEQAASNGIDLIFNTPNQASGPGYLKMGWREVGPVGVMVRPLIRRGERPPSDRLPDPAAFFSGDVPAAGQPVDDRPPVGLRTPRTDEYARWRFSGHPTARYRSIEKDGQVAIVRPNVRSGRKELVISDLFGDHPSRAVRHTARLARAAYMAAWFSPASRERGEAIRGGLVPVPRVRALTLVANPLRELPIDVFDPGIWDISLGDLELL